MNREEILEIFPEAREDQLIALAQIFDRNAGELFQLREANSQLQAQAEAYAAEQAEAVQAAEAEKLVARFEKAVGGREFVHEFVRQSVLDEFLAMLRDEQNAGRSDSEMLEELTRDKGCFVRRYQVTMAAPGDVAPQDMDRLSDAEYYAAFRGKGAQ